MAYMAIQFVIGQISSSNIHLFEHIRQEEGYQMHIVKPD